MPVLSSHYIGKCAARVLKHSGHTEGRSTDGHYWNQGDKVAEATPRSANESFNASPENWTRPLSSTEVSFERRRLLNRRSKKATCWRDQRRREEGKTKKTSVIWLPFQSRFRTALKKSSFILERVYLDVT